MKKTVALLALIYLSTEVYGQAITIAASDMPAPTGNYNVLDFSLDTAANPVAGTGVAWDYSAHPGIGIAVPYTVETDTFFTTAGISVNYQDQKSLIPHYGYTVTKELAFSTTDVLVSGISVPYQGFSLAVLTGGSTDSLIFPAQKYLLPAPGDIIHFPFTANSSWSSVSRRVTNFQVSDSFYLLHHTPGQHVYYVHRKDTIVGYGTLRVYTSRGPSIPYDVLLDKSLEYSQDSFYLNGAPAPGLLLSNFGITQGQKIDSNCKYLFYRKTSFNYLVLFDYGSDNTYSNASAKYVDSENVIPANVGVATLTGTPYTTVLYPVPAAGNELHLLVSGKKVKGGSFRILDGAGRVVAAGTAEAMPGGLTISWGACLPSAVYILDVRDEAGQTLAEERFQVEK